MKASYPQQMKKSVKKFAIQMKETDELWQQAASDDTPGAKRDRRCPRVGRQRAKLANWAEKCLYPSGREIRPVCQCESTAEEWKEVILQKYRADKLKRFSTVKKCAKLGAGESTSLHGSRCIVSICEKIEVTALGDS